MFQIDAKSLSLCRIVGHPAALGRRKKSCKVFTAQRLSPKLALRMATPCPNGFVLEAGKESSRWS